MFSGQLDVLHAKLLVLRWHSAAHGFLLSLEQLRSALSGKYNPNWRLQPRVPAGRPEGGRWTDGGGEADAGNNPIRDRRPRLIPIAASRPRSHSGDELFEPDEIPNESVRRNLLNRNWVNPTGRPIRGYDSQGSGAFGAPRSNGTAHGAADYVSQPGQEVRRLVALTRAVVRGGN